MPPFRAHGTRSDSVRSNAGRLLKIFRKLPRSSCCPKKGGLHDETSHRVIAPPTYTVVEKVETWKYLANIIKAASWKHEILVTINKYTIRYWFLNHSFWLGSKPLMFKRFPKISNTDTAKRIQKSPQFGDPKEQGSFKGLLKTHNHQRRLH